MSSKNYEICEKIVESLAASELIKAFCQSKWQNNQTVFLGIDANNPPPNTNIPMIVVVPDSESFQDDVAVSNGIFVGCTISDDTKTMAGGITKFSGYKTIQDFERLVYDNIDNLLQEFISDYSVLEQGEVRFLSYYPWYQSQRNMKIISERN